MSSVYRKKSGVYYISVSYQGKRITQSLGTKNHNTARSLRSGIEKSILTSIISNKQVKEIGFSSLVDRYLNADHGWKSSTLAINTRLLNNYLRLGLPANQTTRAMTIRVVNGCNRWGVKEELISNYKSIPGGNKYDARNRVFTDDELKLLFNKVTPDHFNQFVRFAYYTGARSGEIRRISRQNVFFDYMFVDGK